MNQPVLFCFSALLLDIIRLSLLIGPFVVPAPGFSIASLQLKCFSWLHWTFLCMYSPRLMVKRSALWSTPQNILSGRLCYGGA